MTMALENVLKDAAKTSKYHNNDVNSHRHCSHTLMAYEACAIWVITFRARTPDEKIFIGREI